MTDREQFEAEYRKRSTDRDSDAVDESLRLDKDSEYLYGNTWTAFYWWQAARATPALPLYYLPDTHRVVSVGLLKKWAGIFCRDDCYEDAATDIRAIIEDKS